MDNFSNEDLKNAIEKKQEELNRLLENETIDKVEALKLSVELDKLIYRYYQYER